MSIILEALRKAEASRRAEDRLELTAAPARPVPFYARIPIGFVAAAATLFVSVGVGAWLLWPEEPASDTRVAMREPAPPAPASTSPAASGTGAVTSSEVASPAPPATAMSSAGAPGAQQEKPAALPAAEPETAGAAATAPPEAGTPASSATTAEAQTPRANAAPPTLTPDSRADVRMLALEARAAEPSASPQAAQGRSGSVEVRDLMGSGAEADDAAGAPAMGTGPSTTRVKPGSVEVRDLLAEQGVAPVAPETSAAAAAPLVSGADGGVRQPAAAKPASVSRSSPPPGAVVPPQAAQPPPRPQQADVPTLDDLVANGELNPPDLSLDMHAYGPEAATRFVYINMRRYHIGDTTREGAVVEDITPDGVVLQLQGRRFVVSAR